MPLYTCHCNLCDHTQEELMKYSDRATYSAPCRAEGCSGLVHYYGKPELPQKRDDVLKGAYRMKAVMGDGSKRKLDSGGNRGDC